MNKIKNIFISGIIFIGWAVSVFGICFFVCHETEQKRIVKAGQYIPPEIDYARQVTFPDSLEDNDNAQPDVEAENGTDPYAEQSVEDIEAAISAEDGVEDIETLERSQNQTDMSISNIEPYVTDDISQVTGSRIEIASADQSSNLQQEQGSNTAYQAYDQDTQTSWQEDADGPGLGSWISYQFEDVRSVNGIVFWLGVWRDAPGKDYYHNNYRPKTIEIRAGNNSWMVTFPDEKVPHAVVFSSPVQVKEIKFTVVDVYNTNIYQDTGIADICIYG